MHTLVFLNAQVSSNRFQGSGEPYYTKHDYLLTSEQEYECEEDMSQICCQCQDWKGSLTNLRFSDKVGLLSVFVHFEHVFILQEIIY